MTEPRPDHTQVNIGLEQVHGRGVTPRVGRDLSSEERWTGFCGLGDSMSDNVAQAKAGKAVALIIHEQRRGIIQSDRASLQIRLDGLDGLCPQRARALFVAFSVDAHIVGTAEAQVVHIKAHQLLCPHACVVEQSEQGIIALSEGSLAVDLTEYFLHLLPFQVFRHASGPALEGNRKDGLALCQMARIGRGEVMKEGMDRSQSVVAGVDAIVPLAFQMIEEAADRIG